MRRGHRLHKFRYHHLTILRFFGPCGLEGWMQMKSNNITTHTLWRRTSPWLLAICWGSGVLGGLLMAFSMEEVLDPLLRQGASMSPSASGLLAATVLPFLLSAFAVSLSEPWLLLIISTFKAFSFSYCACGISLAFGQSSWLVRFLFLFSDLFLVPLLYLFCVRHISGNQKRFRSEAVCCVLIACVLCAVDYCYISPFLVSVMGK